MVNKRQRLSDSPPGAIPTSNRFAPLATDGAKEEMEAEITPRTPAVPPIILPGKDMAKIINNSLKEAGILDYTIKYTANNTNIFVKTTDEHRKLREKLINLNKQYYTYSLQDDKTHAFVLSGLDQDPTKEKLEEELEKNQFIKIKKTYKMTNTRRPLFLVITETEHSLKCL